MPRFCYFSFLILAATLAAQQQPGSVRGQVTSITGEPLRKAEVTIRSTGRSAYAMMATTDASGAFAFENLAPSKYVVSAQRNGFVSQQALGRAGSAPNIQALTVDAGQNLTGVTIKLTPHSIITGKVVDEDGDPMYGASVSVLEERYFRGRRTLSPRSNAMVNDLGEYRIAGLSPGKYYLSASPRGAAGPSSRRVPVQAETERTFVTMFYPGAVESSQATPLTLAAGQEARGIDFQMRRAPTVHVRGHVVDEAGNPVQNMSVMILSADGPGGSAMGGRGAPQKEGAFDIPGILPGKYTLMANRMMPGRGRSSAYLSIQVGSRDLEGVVLQMAPALEVAGTIAAEGDPDLKAARVTLDPMDAFPPDMHSSRNLAAGNAFTIPGVVPGRYRVDVFGAPDGYYLKSVRAGGQELMESGLSISSSVAGLELTLGKGATTVTGAVTDTDGKPLGQALVALTPPEGKRDQWRLFKIAVADQNGQYSIRNLIPGEYKLFAFQPGAVDPASIQNPETLQEVESKGSVVKLGQNATETVPLKVIP